MSSQIISDFLKLASEINGFNSAVEKINTNPVNLTDFKFEKEKGTSCEWTKSEKYQWMMNLNTSCEWSMIFIVQLLGDYHLPMCKDFLESLAQRLFVAEEIQNLFCDYCLDYLDALETSKVTNSSYLISGGKRSYHKRMRASHNDHLSQEEIVSQKNWEIAYKQENDERLNRFKAMKQIAQIESC